jgi:alpha-beta hydrolase superfamily lysophospholipase
MRMSDGFDLFYRRWASGTECKAVLLCLHGGGRSSEYFETLGEALSRRGFEVYAPDLRGYGNSVEMGLSRGDVSNFKRHLQDIVEVAEHIRESHPGQKLFLLGHSYGGNYVVWFAAYHPNTVDGIIAFSPGIKTTLKPPPGLMVKGFFAMLFAPKTTVYSHRMWPESVRDSEDVKFFENNPLDAPGMSARFVLRGIVPLGNKTLRDAALVTVPTLIVQGEADPLVLPAGSRMLLDALGSKDKTLKTFPDADHFYYHLIFPRLAFAVYAMKCEEVVATITEWIGAH